MPTNIQEDEFVYDMARPWHGAANAPAPRIVGGKAPALFPFVWWVTAMIVVMGGGIAWIIALLRGR
jgi:hypothetical protein